MLDMKEYPAVKVSKRLLEIKAGDLGKVGQTLGLSDSKEKDKSYEYEISPFWTIASTVSSGLCAYHGYKRNDSVGWAIGWAFLGGLFPIITPVIAFAQGFGQRKL